MDWLALLLIAGALYALVRWWGTVGKVLGTIGKAIDAFFTTLNESVTNNKKEK